MTDGGWIEAEVTIPHAIADDGGGDTIGGVVIGMDGAAEEGWGTELVEEVAGNEHAAGHKGLAMSDDVEAAQGRKADDALNGSGLVAERVEDRPGDDIESLAVRAIEIARGPHAVDVQVFVGAPVNDAEFDRIPHRQRAIEDGVADGEDGGVCADADGEGKYGDSREGGRIAQGAKTIAEIAAEIFEQRDAAGIATFFTEAFDGAEIDAGGSVGGGRGKAGGLVFASLHFEVKAQFFVEFAVSLFWVKESAEAEQEIVQIHIHTPF